jgi:NADH-quinone oxidoreductase subunit N
VAWLEVFRAAIDAGQAWLAVVAVLNTVVSLYYYLRVIAPTVLQPPPAEAAPSRVAIGAPLAATLLIATIATVVIGVVAEPLLQVAENALMLPAG